MPEFCDDDTADDHWSIGCARRVDVAREYRPATVDDSQPRDLDVVGKYGVDRVAPDDVDETLPGEESIAARSEPRGRPGPLSAEGCDRPVDRNHQIFQSNALSSMPRETRPRDLDGTDCGSTVPQACQPKCIRLHRLFSEILPISATTLKTNFELTTGEVRILRRN